MRNNSLENSFKCKDSCRSAFIVISPIINLSFVKLSIVVHCVLISFSTGSRTVLYILSYSHTDYYQQQVGGLTMAIYVIIILSVTKFKEVKYSD